MGALVLDFIKTVFTVGTIPVMLYKAGHFAVQRSDQDAVFVSGRIFCRLEQRQLGGVHSIVVRETLTNHEILITNE